MRDTPSPKLAPEPFDKTSADIILRSSDKVDFYVYKAVLFLASKFFESMFALEQPIAAVEEKPILDVPEDSNTLENLLRFCYPVYDPSINDLPQLSRVLQAAANYEVPVAIKTLREQLRGFVQARPREVYAIACLHNLNKEAKIAASVWRKKSTPLDWDTEWDFLMTVPGGVFIPEMAGISAGAYFRLIRYLRTGQSTNFCTPLKQDNPPSGNTEVDWTTQAPLNREDADITLRSCDGIEFRAHKLVLVIAGAEALLRSKGRDISADPNHSITLDIDSRVLGPLLRLCYPPSATHVESSKEAGTIDTRTYGDVLDTAVRYEMSALVQAIRSNLAKESTHDALSLYLIAARLGWTSEAQAAAERLLGGPLDELYSPELERTMAIHYHYLLEYHHSCQLAIQEVYKERHYNRPPVFSARYGSGHSTDKPLMRWNEQWFKSQTQSYVRSFPSVLLDAEVGRATSNHNHVVDFQKLIGESQKMDNEIKKVIQKVNNFYCLVYA
ncbi:hypothetical protein EIP86_006923 [Pleurotus ostreatoroseus]|nr:hypothetical protein EIP86_006923 [Pleurotus ostreatoroseus]